MVVGRKPGRVHTSAEAAAAEGGGMRRREMCRLCSLSEKHASAGAGCSVRKWVSQRLVSGHSRSRLAGRVSERLLVGKAETEGCGRRSGFWRQ